MYDLWWQIGGDAKQTGKATFVYGEMEVLANGPMMYYCGFRWLGGFGPTSGYSGIQEHENKKLPAWAKEFVLSSDNPYGVSRHAAEALARISHKPHAGAHQRLHYRRPCRMSSRLIRLICVCARGMALPSKYAGQYVQCPDCHAMLLIPTLEENLLLTRWTCPCGQRLKARSCIAGRKVRCPKCSSEVLIPFSSEHSKVVEENFIRDDKTGIVQRVQELPRGDPRRRTG